MAQDSLEANKPEITIGVLGQDGHGKTSLTSAIVQSNARQNGRVVEGGEIDMRNLWNCTEEMNSPSEYETATRRYKLVDCRRHIDVLKNFVLQWMPLHGAILVVSALDGVTAQTKEQVRMARAVEVPALVVFLNKCDLADDTELLDMVEKEVRDLLLENGYAADTPIIQGSALSALNNSPTDRFDLWSGRIQELLTAIDATIPDLRSIKDKSFLMSIEDVFAHYKGGTVVCGRVERGICHIGTRVELMGFGPPHSAIATDLDQFHKKCDIIYSDDNAGVYLRGLNGTEVRRGQVLAAPGTIRAYSNFRAELYLRTEQENGRNRPNLSGANYLFFLRMTEMNGTLKRGEENSPLHEGEIVRVTIELEMAIAMEPGLRFHLRQNGRSIGYGIVTEPLS